MLTNSGYSGHNAASDWIAVVQSPDQAFVTATVDQFPACLTARQQAKIAFCEFSASISRLSIARCTRHFIESRDSEGCFNQSQLKRKSGGHYSIPGSKTGLRRNSNKEENHGAKSFHSNHR
ncbi:MAG: hypothetical protein U1G07_18920 [Verrucomicrobiota bacterium]